MKVLISCITLGLVIFSQAKEEEWYNADGKLVRVLPASVTKEEWKPHWQRKPEYFLERFTWDTRRPYVRSAQPYHSSPYHYNSYGWASGYHYAPYRLYGYCRPSYGIRGYYSSSGNWGIRIGN
ncbi:hypothetical protein ACFPK9_03610 [Rubritalea spongiae]|uniref:DUF3300 domain-containing protein n=1 Tax=Rubritalea spongiae TaxID=430797 RepID=A0ABW5E7X9_9BACT